MQRTKAGPTPASRARFAALLLCLLAAAALAAAFAFAAPAHAQADTYVDLSVEVTPGSGWNFTARNHGTATAYGVTMDVELGDQAISLNLDGDERRSPEFEQKSGTTCSGNIPGTTCLNGTFPVGDLAPGEEKSFFITPKLAPGLPCCTLITTNWTVPARAVVKSTLPVEEERFKGDNTAVGWISVDSRDDTLSSAAAETEYRLEASVDDLLPDTGDTVKFTFSVTTPGGTHRSVYGAKLRLKLDEGMGTPNATPPTGTTFGAATGLSRTWDWDFDLVNPTTLLELVATTTLDNPFPAGVDRSDLCLTAELTAERPADRVPGDNSAEICLREYPVSLLQTGETDLLDLYPCVGITTYPCSNTDTLELLINGREAASAAGVVGNVTNNVVEANMNPARVVVQVKDPDGRGQVSNSTVWRTGSNENDDANDAGIIPGVVAFMRLPSPDFNQYSFSIADSTPGGKPGTVRIVNQQNTGFEILNIDSKTSLGPLALTNTSITVLFEFGDLGTYGMDITEAATHVDTSTQYDATSTYTFHVGPVAELEMQDGGVSPEVATGQRAFTIVAKNNGPDDAPAAQVSVTGLSSGQYVSHSVTAGTFDSGTGVWTIGELRKPGYLQDIYGRDGEVLTIITNAQAGSEIAAEIENTQDYEVCIDSAGDDVVLTSPSETACTNEDATNSWHTTAYYDYITGNNTTTIMAQAGTGAALPVVQSAQEDTASIVVEWAPVSALNGRPVTHYEVQRETNPWTTLADNVPGTRYVDTDVEAGDTFRYRVRAVNDRDHKGPWSAPMEGTVPAPVTVTAGVPDAPVLTSSLADGATGRTQIDLAWDKPVENGAFITSYTLEVSDGRNGPWAEPTPAPQLGPSDTSWSHTGLTGGARKFYRMKATNSEGDSDWSAVLEATTRAPGKAGPPLGVRAAPDGASAIDVSWLAPVDDGGSPSSTTRCSGPPTARPAGATPAAPPTPRPAPSRTPA